MPTSTLYAIANAFTHFYSSEIGLVEFVSAIISASLLAWIVVAAIRTNYVGIRVERFRHLVLRSNLPKVEATKAWQRIESHFYRGNENDLKVAVIDADKLLDEALREAGVRGSTPGDRLKNVKPGQLPDLDGVWQAHKLRNQIAHEPNFKIKRDLAERAINVYADALRSLGSLD
jgi:hypothetical protein